MRLTVGPEDRRADLVNAAEAAWNEFAAAVGRVPCGCDPTRFDDLGRSSNGVASSFVFAGPQHRAELALIVLSVGFFDRPANERILTLLHECIHLRFMIGPLLNRVIGSLALDQIHGTPATAVGDERLFLNQRVYLAFALRNFIDEILAELYLKAEYPAYLRDRITYYLAMRRGSVASWQQAADTLKPTALLHEILKNDLGILMAYEHPEAAEFTAMSAELQRELRGLCSDGDFRRHMLLRDRLMWVTLEPLAYDDAAYCAAFMTTIALPRTIP